MPSCMHNAYLLLGYLNCKDIRKLSSEILSVFLEDNTAHTPEAHFQRGQRRLAHHQED